MGNRTLLKITTGGVTKSYSPKAKPAEIPVTTVFEIQQIEAKIFSGHAGLEEKVGAIVEKANKEAGYEFLDYDRVLKWYQKFQHT